MDEGDLQIITEQVVNDLGLVFNALDERPYIRNTYGLYERKSRMEMRSLVCASLGKLELDWTASILSYVLQYADVYSERVDDFDSNSDYVMLTNGAYNLKEAKFSKKYPSDAKYTAGLTFPFKPKGKVKATRFLQYLEEITLGDEELKTTLLEVMGALLAGDANAQKLLLLVGSGANSKSCFMDLCKNFVPTANVSSLSIRAINSNRDFDRHWLRNSRLNIVNELENRQTLESIFNSSVKALVTGDVMSGEIKGGDKYTFTPACTLMVATNHLPGVRGCIPNYSILRRYLVLPFLAQFKPEQQDPELDEKLKKELPGIFHYALEGWERLRSNNYLYTYQKKSDLFIRAELRRSFPYLCFVDECIQKKSGCKLFNNRRFKVFERWCEANDVSVAEQNSHEISKKITEAITGKWPDVMQNKANGNRYSLGIDIVDDWK